MSDWPSLFRAPENAAGFNGWFSRIADRLLNDCSLLVGQQPHRLIEIELYYWSKAHPDPFAHRDPIQFEVGHWYFHRAHGVYRGGSFKGLDLTFGNAGASGGALIRGLETPDGTFVDGPSLCVDYLLKATGTKTVTVLDRTANKSLAWEKGNPLRLHEMQDSEYRAPMRSPRVGLSLKRAASSPESTRFLMLPYRYLTEPRRTRKGKILLVLALHAQGLSLAEIRQRTNCTRRAIERYVADFERGCNEADFAPYLGVHLAPSKLCKLYGVWFTHWGFHGEMR